MRKSRVNVFKKKASKKMTPELFVSDYLNLDLIKSHAISGINSTDVYVNDNGEKETYVADLVSGAYGSKMGEFMSDLFEISYNEDGDEGDNWSEIEQFGDKVADVLNEKLQLDGSFYLGYLESDGSYGIFYTEEADKEEDIEKTSKSESLMRRMANMLSRDNRRKSRNRNKFSSRRR